LITLSVTGLKAVTATDRCPRKPSAEQLPADDHSAIYELMTRTGRTRMTANCTSTSSIDLIDTSDRVRATYSGLTVTDVSGRLVRSNMSATDDGRSIAISVDDEGADYPLKVDPTWSESEELAPSNSVQNGYFGSSVAVSGTTAVVGADGWYASNNYNDRVGTAYVYSQCSCGYWNETAQLVPGDGVDEDEFGDAVATSGSTIVVGAPDRTVGTNSSEGVAYIFSDAGGSWSQVAELTPSDGQSEDEFGSSVAISNGTVFVGAPNYSVNGVVEGRVYVFGMSGGSWTPEAELTSSDAASAGGDESGIGTSLAASGSTLVTGAPGYYSWQGRAYEFTLNSGTWQQNAEFTAPDYQGEFFGSSIATNGSIVVVGSPGSYVGDVDAAGQVYEYSLSAGENLVAVLDAPDPNTSPYLGFFGQSVAIAGSQVVATEPGQSVGGVSDEGAAYDFPLGMDSTPTAELVASDGGFDDDYADAVAASGLTIFIGASFHGYAGPGAAYIYDPYETQPAGLPVLNDAYGGGSGSEPCQCSGGGSVSSNPVTLDPVDLATGDFTESSTDISLPGPGVPLKFTRTYDAQEAQAAVTNGEPAPPLGYGWSDNLGMNISVSTVQDDPDNNGATASVATVTEENGAETSFTYPFSISDDPWCASVAAQNTLNTQSDDGVVDWCATAPRMDVTLSQNASGVWSYTRTTGTSPQDTFAFASSGTLTAITDVSGNSLVSTTYSAGAGQTACPSGDTCEAWTSSASGRQLVLASNGSGHLVSVFDPNAGESVEFSYSGTGCSSWSGSETPDLCSVVDPGGVTSSFTYDSGDSSVDFDYDVLTETPLGSSGTTTNVYNSVGQISQQTDPAGAVATVSYSGTNASLDGGTTTVTSYPDGMGSGEPESSVIYDFSSNVLIGETAGAGANTASNQLYLRDPASLLPITIEDGNGGTSSETYQGYSGSGDSSTTSANLIASTDAMGNTTQHAYNAFNQAWCTVDPAETAAGVTCPPSAPSSPPEPGAPGTGATINIYNSADQLTATTDALGNTTTYSYTSGVSGIPNGLMYCSVDPVDYRASVTCPAYGAAHVTGTTTSTFDSAGDVLTSTNADGDTTTSVYGVSGHPGLVSSTTDPDGTVTSYTYNAAGEVLSQVVSFSGYSATTQFAYDAEGRRYCEDDPSNYANGVRCSTSPPSASSPPAGVTSTFYDADGRVIQSTNAIGGTTLTAYDGAGNVYCTVSPADYANAVRCPSAEPTTPPSVGSDPYLGATITTYDANGRAIQVTNPLGGITLTSYDADNNVTQTTVESNNATSDPDVVTTKTYDADDQNTSTTVDPSSSQASTTEQSYDPDGNVYCSVSANATAAGSSAYQCPPWQGSWITSPPTPTSLYSSSPSSTQANNVTTTFFNDDGQQVQTTNPDVETTADAIDGDGRTYCSVDPVNYANAVTCPVEGAAHVTGTTTTTYDPAGQTLTTTDQLGDVTSYTYDEAGHVLTTTDPGGKVTTNCYYDENASGQCAYGAPAGGGSGDALYTTTTPSTGADPSGETTAYTYYPGGQTDTKSTPSATATTAYDANGDLLSTTYSGIGSGYSTPANTSKTYNSDGSVATMTDATGTTTYGYDAMGDEISQALVAAGGTGLTNATTSYTYYSTGAKASIVYPAYGSYSSPTVTYAYDGTGAMVSETDWLGNTTTFPHDADGNTTGQDNDVSGTNPNGTSSTSLTYDGADENTGATSTIDQTCGSSESLTQSLSGSSGSRNLDGQLTSETTSYSASCSGQSTSTLDYAYDAAGRVTYQGTVAQGSNPSTYSYDASGDPTTLTSHATSGGSTDTYTQAYDNAGEVTSQAPVSTSGGSTTSYSYDTLGDQTGAGGGTNATYAYNGAGQMASAITPTTTTNYLYNGDGLEGAASQIAGSTVWNPPVDVDSNRAIKAVSCASATFCVAVGASGYVTTYNGTSWSTPYDADSTRTLDAVSCVSSSFCVAVDTAGWETTWTGTGWSSPSDIDSSHSLDAVDCVATNFCAAVGASGSAVTFNGSTWPVATPDSTRTLEAVSCASATFCAAVGTSGYATIYTGSWASATDIDPTHTLDTVACPSTMQCVAAGASGYAITYTSPSWASASPVDSTNTIKAVSCPSTTLCVAVDTSGDALTDALSGTGSSWSAPTDVDGSNAFAALSCASATSCDAIDSSDNVVTYGTSGWAASASNIDDGRTTAALSCPTSTSCIVGDSSGYATVFSTMTEAWGPPNDVVGEEPVAAMTCTSATFCVATGFFVAMYNGTSWATPLGIDLPRAIEAISCVTSSFCMAVDSSGYYLTWNGTSWSTPMPSASSDSLSAVDCVSTTFCAAVGSSGNVETYNGTLWTSGTADGSRNLDAVTCTSATMCLAVDESGYSTTWNGTSWATATDIDSNRDIDTIACASATTCVAASNSGYAVTYSSGTWASRADVDGGRNIKAVSCPSSNLCVAVDTSGYALTYNGTSWSPPTDIDGSTALEALSCPSTISCDAADASGNVLTYNGSSWSDPSDVDPTHSATAVSCPTPNFCGVADSDGDAVVDQPLHESTTTSQLIWDTTGSLPLVLSDGSYDYLYGPSGTPVEQIALTTSTPTYMTYSSSDSTWLTTNEAGDETGFWGYDAFGSLSFGTPTSAFGYAGQYADASTGLVNDRARFYDPQTGGFTTRDPDFASTDTAYTYAGDDPVNESDPTGDIDSQQFWSFICGVGSGDPYIGIACDLFSQGLPSLGGLACEFGTNNPSQPCPGNENRGVIQAQGTTGNPKTNKGSKWTESEPWSQGNPPTVSYGLALVDALIGKLTQKQYDQRKQSFADLVSFIVGCAPGGGCTAGPPSSWHDRGYHPAQRVDIQVYAGLAFIPDNGIYLTSYVRCPSSVTVT